MSMPDAPRLADEIRAAMTAGLESCLEGTTTGVEHVRITNRTVLTVTDAGIVGLVQHYEPETLEALYRLAR